MILLIMTKLTTMNTNDFTYTDTTYNLFYLQLSLIITVNKNMYVMSHLLML